MITDLQRAKYSSDGSEDKCEWWTWTETCDDCGVIIFMNGEMLSTSKPNKTDEVYCTTCLRRKLNERRKDNGNQNRV